MQQFDIKKNKVPVHKKLALISQEGKENIYWQAITGCVSCHLHRNTTNIILRVKKRVFAPLYYYARAYSEITKDCEKSYCRLSIAIQCMH